MSDKAAPDAAPQTAPLLWGRRLLTLAVAAAGGYAAFSLKIPLP